MKRRKEDYIKSEKLQVKLEAEKAKDFSKDFQEIDDKILGCYEGLELGQKLQDASAIHEAMLNIEKLRAKKFTTRQNHSQEIERLERELKELAVPYIEGWVEELKRESKRIMEARTFDTVKVERDIAGSKYFTVNSNLTHAAEVTQKIESGIRELRSMVASLVKIEVVYQRTLDGIPETLKIVRLELNEFDFNEIRDALAPVAGKAQEVNYFMAEKMVKQREDADLYQALKQSKP